MTDGDFTDGVELVGKLIDALGVLTIVVGILVATATLAVRHRREDDPFRSYRQGIGWAILLGLEFLVAADIIRTVAVEPSFENAGVLAIIVLIRTFLSFTLELELSGRWPWQSGSSADAASDGPGDEDPGRPGAAATLGAAGP